MSAAHNKATPKSRSKSLSPRKAPGRAIDSATLEASLSAIREIAKARRGEPIRWRDYHEYRKNVKPQLLSMGQLYGVKPSWKLILLEAGVVQPLERRGASKSPQSQPLFSRQEIIAVLQRAARDCGAPHLSTGGYDAWRKARNERLPSSTLVRKHFLKWDYALIEADLPTRNGATSRNPSRYEISSALASAHAEDDNEGYFTPGVYEHFREGLSSERRWYFPSVDEVVAEFRNWDAALEYVGIDQLDPLHGEAHWTRDEARRVFNNVVRVLGHEPTEAEYTAIAKQSVKPLPEWSVLCELVPELISA